MLSLFMNKIKQHEGLKLKPYNCSAGVLTIGYGHNLENGITKKQAELLFEVDFENCIADVDKVFGEDVDIFSEVYGVLLDLMFNLGYERFCGFKKFIAAIKCKDYHKAADELVDSKWYRQVGTRAVWAVNTIRGVV